jgi:hypothetical protein
LRRQRCFPSDEPVLGARRAAELAEAALAIDQVRSVAVMLELARPAGGEK